MDKTQYTPLSQGDENALESQRDESYPMSRSRADGSGSGPAPAYPPYRDMYNSRQSESSFSDDEDVLKHPIDPLEEEDEDYGDDMSHKKRPTVLKVLLWSLGAIIFSAILIGIVAARSYNGAKFRTKGRKHIEMDHVFNGTFWADSKAIHWVPEAGDGVFSLENFGEIQLVDLKTNKTTTLVRKDAVKDEHGRVLSWDSWKLSWDAKYLLLQADRKKQWRHSSLGNYYIHDLQRGKTQPLVAPTNPPVISYATWAPSRNSIAYVSNNDLYVVPAPGDAPIRVTEGGTSTIFHAVPDWVYEEEVFSSDYALWWSPDSSKISFLRFDETKVDEFTYPVYNPTTNSDEVVPYPSHVTMKYPKPGYDNPLVSVHLFDFEGHLASEESLIASLLSTNTRQLSWESQRPQTDSIIQEVAWVGNSSLIIKEVNRSGDTGHVVLFDLSHPNRKGRIVRKLGKEAENWDNGWIDSAQRIRPLVDESGQVSSYLDVLPNEEGYNHIALFSPVDSSIPKWVTTGSWEVTSGILGLDNEKGLVYFVAASPSSIDRNVYSAKIPSGGSVSAEPVAPTAMTDARQSTWYSASFSPQSGFYSLNYEGPLVPWQKILKVDNATFQYPVVDNRSLNETSAKFQMPTIVKSTIISDGYEINTMEIRPPDMDDSGKTKYAVLFRVYGGPGSQMVTNRWDRDWHHYLACSLKYIVVTVDGRGTGYKGRKLRNPVRGNLGQYEVIDQINAARHWASKRYVDSRRIGIWGWSYGGFMSSKVVEANAGVHSLAMAVAPVTSWRLYDSIYTERYMGLPANNPDGYVNASISNVEGFKKVDFLLAHGSGDDNVHFANSAHLLDMFTAAQIRRFRFRMFTDSDHSIQTRGAYRELHEWMTEFLVEKWGKGGYRRGW